MFRIVATKTLRNFRASSNLHRRSHQVGVRCFSGIDKGTDSYNNSNNNNEIDQDDEEWIPPSRPLSGDQGQSHLYKEAEQVQEAEQMLEDAIFTISDDDSEEEILRKLEEALALEEEMEKQQLEKWEKEEEEAKEDEAKKLQAPEGATSEQVDWLATRRMALGEESKTDVLSVLKHELLTKEELLTFLEHLGGTDLSVFVDKDERMGGADGMIMCTATSTFQIRTITQTLVSHLKERKLQDLGVLGAQMGSSAFHNNSSTNWNVIDCQNYIVHIFDEHTRRSLNLEELWSGKDDLLKLNITDENAVDDYVADNPVPYDYGPNPDQLWDSDISRLEKNRFSAPHRPVVPGSVKSQDRKDGKRRRRQQREEQSWENY